MSFAYWVKINTATSTNWLDTFSWYSTNGSNNYRNRQEFYTNSTRTNIWYKASSANSTNSSFVNMIGEWNHYAFTIDYDKGEACFYINGEITGTKKANIDTTSYIKGTGSAFLLRENGLDSHINDFRLYDHILSPLEVKQISQGLILHYPLNNNGFGQKNLLPISGSTIINSTKSFEFQGWVQSFYTKTWMNEHLVSGKQYILSYTVICLSIPDSAYVFKEDRHSPILVHQGSGLNQITITNDGIKNTKMSVGQSRSYKCIFTFSTIPEEKKEYYGLCGYTALYRNSSNAAQYARFRIDNLKLEEGGIVTPWCPNEADELYQKIKIDDNIEYDCSGFQKNGEKIGIDYSSDTPKYDVSSVFSASPSVIKIPNQNYAIQGSQSMTISVWAYKEDWSQYSERIYSCTEGGGLNIQPTSSGQIEWAVNVYTDAEKTSHKYDTNLYIRVPKTDFSSGWHMFTWVYTTNGTSLYVDGILKQSKTGTSYGLYFHSTAPLILGGQATSINYTSPYLDGKLSDFRIYVTALSAEDILALYKNSVYIDNEGNLYGAELREV